MTRRVFGTVGCNVFQSNILLHYCIKFSNYITDTVMSLHALQQFLKRKNPSNKQFFPSVVGLPDIDPITFLILSVYYKVWSLEMTVSVHTAKYCPLLPSSFMEFLLYKICSFNSFLLKFFLLNGLCNSMSHGSRARLRGLFCLSRVFRLPRVSRAVPFAIHVCLCPYLGCECISK